MRVWTTETENNSASSMVNNGTTTTDSTTTTNKRKTSSSNKKEKAARKKARAEEKARIMEQVPKVDGNGIAYTKQQLRRMRKRVARGLHPIESPAETQERKAREAQLKREEEAELAGLFIHKQQTSNTEDKEGEESVVEEEEEEEAAEEQESTEDTDTPEEQIPPTLTNKKKKRCKPVPNDYICSACQNAITPAHWIYDCPQKKTLRGTNQKSKKLRGLHDPSEKKLFVSGLPFETTVGSVKKLFETKSGITPSFVKLVKFKDSERCRGQAYVSFASAEDANKAKVLDGEQIQGPCKSEQRKKDLKLSVTSVLNRFVTSKKDVKAA